MRKLASSATGSVADAVADAVFCVRCCVVGVGGSLTPPTHDADKLAPTCVSDQNASSWKSVPIFDSSTDTDTTSSKFLCLINIKHTYLYVYVKCVDCGLVRVLSICKLGLFQSRFVNFHLFIFYIN